MYDIIVIGASAGGLPAITQLIGLLPENFPASLFITIHVQPESTSHLPIILRRAGKLEAVFPRKGEPIRPGYIYIAPPNWHMIVEDHQLQLVDGPRENGARPAIDPLFRSAAETFQGRVIGIILSGSLDDGTAGMASIKASGGLTIVQDPEEAEFDSMPRSAIEHVMVDYILPVAEIAPLLVQLVDSTHKPNKRHGNSGIIPMETGNQQNSANLSSPHWDMQFKCPECGGVLLPLQSGEYIHFRCEVGHYISPRTLLADQRKEIEYALWSAIRALQEKARLCRKLASDMHVRGVTLAAEGFEQQASEAEKHAETLQKVMTTINIDETTE